MSTQNRADWMRYEVELVWLRATCYLCAPQVLVHVHLHSIFISEFLERLLQKDVINLVELLELHRHVLEHRDLRDLEILRQRDAGRRQRNRDPRRSTQSRARDHRVLDRSTREKCS